MDEVTLLKLWNQKRSQVISAQLAPTIILASVLITAGFGKFDSATSGIKYLALVITAVTGILSVITQYAAIREGEALVRDLSKVDKPSALAKTIADSRSFLSLTAIAIVLMSIASMTIVVVAVLG